MIIPAATSSSAAAVLNGPAGELSESRSAERMTPKTGFIKPKTDTDETGLYFSRRLHSEKAAAEMKPRYRSIAAPEKLTLPILPPESAPTAVIKAPPVMNCQLLSITGSEERENFFVIEAENA